MKLRSLIRPIEKVFTRRLEAELESAIAAKKMYFELLSNASHNACALQDTVNEQSEAINELRAYIARLSINSALQELGLMQAKYEALQIERDQLFEQLGTEVLAFEEIAEQYGILFDRTLIVTERRDRWRRRFEAARAEHAECADKMLLRESVIEKQSERLAAQAQRLLELEHDLEGSARELARWQSIGYPASTVASAAEQLVIEGAPGGEPSKLARVDFKSVEQEGFWEVRRLSFVERNKWSFSEGAEAGEFTAEITDKDFRGRVDRREFAFAHGDVVHGSRLVESWRDEDGKQHAKYTITKVHAVITPGESQLRLDAQPAATPVAI